MARNGSGTYNLLTNSWNPATNGVSASPTDWQNLINDVAAALTQSLSADGQTPVTGNINMGGNRLTNLNAPSANGDALSQGNNASVSGLNFTGAGRRITGDFSNGTVANRVMFQTSTVNGSSVVGVIPNGTATSGHFRAYSNSDPTNASYLGLLASGIAEARLESGREGAGSYLPMTFYTGGSERMRIDTSGNVGIGATPTAGRRLDVSSGTGTFAARFASNAGGASLVSGDAAGILLCHNFSNGSAEANFIYGVPASTGLTFGAWNGTTYTQVAQFGPTGGFQLTSPFGLGYGTGAGGSVTQTTSKSTAVTLNRPVGRITTNNEALGAGQSVVFLFFNNLVTINDLVVFSQTNPGGNKYLVSLDRMDAGYFVVRLQNVSASSLSEAVSFNFAIIKGAIS